MRAALTQTSNRFTDMPDSIHELSGLAGRLDQVRAANLTHHIELMRAAADRGVQAICFGELFTGPYFAHSRSDVWFGLAEQALDGPTVKALAPVARELSMVVVAPLYEKAGEEYFNTAVIIDADGTILGRYRKIHIPNGSNEAGTFSEAFYFGPSDGDLDNGAANLSSNPYFPVFQTAYGRIGVSICYDRHFEGVVRSLVANGAQLIFCPAVTYGEKSRRMWHMEFAVDAMRHRVAIGGSNRVGAEAPWNQPTFGESYFCSPEGVCDNLSDHSNLIIADVDLDALDAPDPAGWNLARDVRPDRFDP